MRVSDYMSVLTVKPFTHQPDQPGIEFSLTGTCISPEIGSLAAAFLLENGNRIKNQYPSLPPIRDCNVKNRNDKYRYEEKRIMESEKYLCVRGVGGLR